MTTASASSSAPPTPSFPPPKHPGALPTASAAPANRVPYANLSSIDWIHETTKERYRLRSLRATNHGFPSHLSQLTSASQVWIILIGTGLAVGALAACIDVATAWLGDLKIGYCSGGGIDGGSVFLNRNFCCLGYEGDNESKCADWSDWTTILPGFAGWFTGYTIYIITSVLFAGSAALLVREYALFAKHSGIPELKTVISGLVMHDFLSGWTLTAKSLGLCLSVASGMWLGKEGPLVHVACCVAAQLIRLFPVIDANEARKREVLTAAAAAGISVAFGSPIGGVLFSIEALSYFPDKTMWHAFVCAMTAAVMLQAFDPFRSGKLVLYQSQYTVDWHDFELLPYMCLGLLGGLYGGLFVRLNMWVQRKKAALAVHNRLPSPMQQVLIVAVITAILNFPNFYLKVPTSHLVTSLFAECTPHHLDTLGLCKTGSASLPTILVLLTAAAVAFFLSAATFGLQIPAGILLPSIAIGALLGRSVGIAMELYTAAFPGFVGFASCAPDLPCVTPGTYAIVGAAAALAGVTRTTVSIVVIIFELTGALTFVLPIMVAVMLAKWTGDALSRHSIYDSWIRWNGYPLVPSESSVRPADEPIGRATQFMTRTDDLVVLEQRGADISALQTLLSRSSVRGFPVVRDVRSAILIGYISRGELQYALEQAVSPTVANGLGLSHTTEVVFVEVSEPGVLDLRQWMDETPLTLNSRAEMHLVVRYFQKLGIRYVLFVDRGALAGLLTKKDVWYILDGEMDENSRGERFGNEADLDDDGDHDGQAREGLLAVESRHHRAYSITSPGGLL